jgi:hypothetical protein
MPASMRNQFTIGRWLLAFVHPFFLICWKPWILFRGLFTGIVFQNCFLMLKIRQYRKSIITIVPKGDQQMLEDDFGEN